MPRVFAGQLFFKKPDGSYVCSAQFISKRVLLTAAHCVRDDETGDFYDDIVFALQYDKGKYLKAYDYDCAATLNGWVQPGDEKWTYDFAMILVQEDSKSGWFGTTWNWNGFDQATKIGYPGGILNGQVIQVDAGPISVENGIVELRHGNQADQGGSSGGAWIGDYSTAKGDYNHIISVESFGYDGQPGVDYGPYLDDRLKVLWDYVENGCK
jgi:V8-like Glu-specific endopeptidase